MANGGNAKRPERVARGLVGKTGARIRRAQRDAAAEDPNILPGPCFADWVGDESRLHYVDVDADGADGPGGAPGIVPARWLASVRHLIGGPPATSRELGCGP